MTTKELLDEYAGVMYVGYMETVESQEKRKEEIIKELEASIRREVVLSLLERLSSLEVREPLPKHLTALDIHIWANEQGITLN